MNGRQPGGTVRRHHRRESVGIHAEGSVRGHEPQFRAPNPAIVAAFVLEPWAWSVT